jgi:DNA-binding transcriptional MerR regulator
MQEPAPPTTRTSSSPSGRPSAGSGRRAPSEGRRLGDPADPGADGSGALAAGADGGKLYYRIGEVSRLTGVKAHVLRYWESEFRWMAPAKSRSQQRLYRQRDIEIIRLLKRLLHEQRFTIAGARKRLRDLGIARALEEPVVPELDLGLEIDHRSRYRRIREELEAIRAELLR